MNKGQIGKKNRTNFGKMFDECGTNMDEYRTYIGQIWNEYGRSMDKYRKNIGQIWDEYGTNMGQIEPDQGSKRQHPIPFFKSH